MRLSTHAKRQEHFNFQMSHHQENNKKNTLQAAKDKVSDINNYKHKNGPFFGRGMEIEHLCVTSNSSDDTSSLSTLFTVLLKTWFWHIAISELTCYIPSAPGGQPYPFPVENLNNISSIYSGLVKPTSATAITVAIQRSPANIRSS